MVFLKSGKNRKARWSPEDGQDNSRGGGLENSLELSPWTSSEGGRAGQDGMCYELVVHVVIALGGT